MSKADPSRKRFEQAMRVMTGAFPTDKEPLEIFNRLRPRCDCRLVGSPLAGAGVNAFTPRRRDAVAV